MSNCSLCLFLCSKSYNHRASELILPFRLGSKPIRGSYKLESLVEGSDFIDYQLHTLWGVEIPSRNTVNSYLELRFVFLSTLERENSLPNISLFEEVFRREGANSSNYYIQ